MKRYFQAMQNDDGKSFYLNEYRWDEESMMMRRETLADGLSLTDAEYLVKVGNRLFSALELLKPETVQS